MTSRTRGDGNRPLDRRRRRGPLVSIGATVALLCVATAATVGMHDPAWRHLPLETVPVVVITPAPAEAHPSSPIRLDGALVRGARRDWAVDRKRPPQMGEPVPVQLTAYCLQGTTRRDQFVREGIVAADPKLFPLGRYIEVYVGREYYGRFLIDDTGSRIRDGILDIWTPNCHDASRFGRQRGTAVLVPRPRGAHRDTLLTGRLGRLGAH